MSANSVAVPSRARALATRPTGFALAIALIAGLGLLLRVLAARPGFLGDELYTYSIASHDSLGDVIDGVRTTENTPPLYYVLAWVSLKATGVPELVRLPSLVAGTGLVAVAGFLGRRVSGARAGVVAAALVAVSPFAIYYGSEARSYAPAAFCVLLSTLFVLRALESGARRDWGVFALAAAGAMWFHYTAFFPLVVQAAWAFATFPCARRQVLLAHAGAAALYLPWLPFAGTYVPLTQVSKFINLYAPLTLPRTLEYELRSLVGHPNAGLAEAPGTVALVALGMLVLVALVVLVRRGAGPRATDPVVLLGLTALASPIGVLVVSLAGSNIYLPRNLFVSASAALVLLGAAVASFAAPAAVAAGLAIVALLAPSAVSLATGDLARPAYDRVARLVDARARAGDPVIEAPLFPGAERTPNAPLRRPLLSFFTRPHRVYFSDIPSPGWRAARRAGRAFAVYPTTDSRLSNLLRPKPPQGSGFVVVDQRVFEGTPQLAYVEYERRR